MKLNKYDTLLVAYLLERTKYTFYKVFQFSLAFEYYFYLNEDYNPNDNELLNFIEDKTKDILTKEEIKELHNCYIEFITAKLTDTKKQRLIKKMITSMTNEDMELVDITFIQEAFRIATYKKPTLK